MEADLLGKLVLGLYYDDHVIIPIFWADGDTKTTKHLQDILPYSTHREPCFAHLVGILL